MFFYGFSRRWVSNKLPAELSATLKSVSEATRWGVTRYETEFLGTVTQESFRLSPYRRHVRNSFCPLALGKVQSIETGCTVDVRFRMWLPLLFFSILWCVPLIQLFLFGALILFTGDVADGFLLTLMPLLFLGFEFLMEFLAFYLPAKRMEQRLQTLLEAKETSIEST